MEMRDKVLSSVGLKDFDTSGYQASDLVDFEFFRENDQLDVKVVFRPSIDIPFDQQRLRLGDGRFGRKTNLLDGKEDKENSPPTTPLSERPTGSTA